MLPTLTYKVFETNSSFHVKSGTRGKSLIYVFQEFSASINKTFILGHISKLVIRDMKI